MREKTQGFQQDKLEFIKNSAVLEFLGLPNNSGYIEAELGKAIIDHNLPTEEELVTEIERQKEILRIQNEPI